MDFEPSAPTTSVKSAVSQYIQKIRGCHICDFKRFELLCGSKTSCSTVSHCCTNNTDIREVFFAPLWLHSSSFLIFSLNTGLYHRCFNVTSRKPLNKMELSNKLRWDQFLILAAALMSPALTWVHLRAPGELMLHTRVVATLNSARVDRSYCLWLRDLSEYLTYSSRVNHLPWISRSDLM